MIVLVCGGREYANQEHLFAILDKVHGQKGIDLIIEGGAKGADELARLWGSSRGVHVATVKALWTHSKHAAGPKRNRAMLLLKPDVVIAFPGGKGTANMIGQAKLKNIPIIEV